MKEFIIEQAKPEDAALLLDYMKVIGGETDNLSFGAEDIHINVDGKAEQLAAQQQSKDSTAGGISCTEIYGAMSN